MAHRVTTGHDRGMAELLYVRVAFVSCLPLTRFRQLTISSDFQGHDDCWKNARCRCYERYHHSCISGEQYGTRFVLLASRAILLFIQHHIDCRLRLGGDCRRESRNNKADHKSSRLPEYRTLEADRWRYVHRLDKVSISRHLEYKFPQLISFATFGPDRIRICQKASSKVRSLQFLSSSLSWPSFSYANGSSRMRDQAPTRKSKMDESPGPRNSGQTCERCGGADRRKTLITKNPPTC